MHRTIAFPSFLPGGLEAPRCEHFGHCDSFTLVQIEDSRVSSVEVLENADHEEGGCTSVVEVLQNAGVDEIVVGGMGMRPLTAFQVAGIDVYFDVTSPSVGESLASLLDGRLTAMSADMACGGHGGGCGGHH